MIFLHKRDKSINQQNAVAAMPIQAMDKLVIDNLLIEEDIPAASSDQQIYAPMSSDDVVRFNNQQRLVEAEIEREVKGLVPTLVPRRMRYCDNIMS